MTEEKKQVIVPENGMLNRETSTEIANKKGKCRILSVEVKSVIQIIKKLRCCKHIKYLFYALTFIVSVSSVYSPITYP